jgi:putative hydrolase of the HAD superfamily
MPARTHAAPAAGMHVSTAEAAGVRNPLDARRRIRAVLFDLDGTLYRQRLMRSFMALELVTLPFAAPLRARRRLRALTAFRKAQEHLRASDAGLIGSVSAAQLANAAAHAGLPVDEVERVVDEWMAERPLKYMRWCRAPGIVPLLDWLEQRGVSIGVLSDYPAESKVKALGLEGRFSPILCSTDPGIGALKPNPRGFLRACELWQLAPGEVLAVGDRVEVDAAGALAAGLPCVVLGRSEDTGRTASGYVVLPSYERLRRALADN